VATPQPVLQNSGDVTTADVFKQRCEEHRHYSDIRFKQLTLWFAATALLINEGFSEKGGLNLAQHPLLVPISGALITAVFWVMEVRATLKGVEALESIKLYRNMLPGPTLSNWTFVNHTNATLLLYAVSFAIWAVLVRRTTVIWAIGVLFAVGVVLFFHTVREYKYLWKDAWCNWNWKW
jgi:hypothetical protein